mgnify:FL=1
MKEADFQRQWRDYVSANPPIETEAYELKIVKTLKQKSFPFAAVKDHQIIGLQLAIDGSFYKISDSPIFPGMKTRFTAPKPFDCYFMKASNAFVVVMFYFPRRPKVCYKIPVDKFIEIRDSWKRKSIKEEELREIGYQPIYL